MRDMSEVECAYIGALVDGEGCVCQTRDKYRYWQVRVGNTDPELISVLLRATGAGCVYGQAKNSAWGTKPISVWQLAKQNDVLCLARRCAPFSFKLQRILEE